MILAGQTVRLEDLDLRFGDARLSGNARYGTSEVAASLKLAPTPLTTFAALGAPALKGQVEASIDVSGSPRSPQVRAELAVRDAVPANAAGLQIPPGNLNLDATLAGGKLETSARLSGITESPLTARAVLPVTLRLQPFEFSLPRDQPISGQVVGEADLARLGKILALDAQRVAGRLKVDVALDGSVAAPRASGEIRIDDGVVEDAITGVLVRDLQVRIVGNQNRLTLERLSARDREAGTLSGSGQLQLDGTTPSAFQVALKVNNFRALRNEYGVADVSGDLTVAGDLTAAQAKGNLRVERADLRIPEMSGGGPPTISVRVAGEKAPEEGKGSAVPSPKIALNIAVDLPGQVYVRGRGLESEWGGGLKVEGTTASPLVTGQIAAKRGYLDLLGQRFTIDRGEISFDGRQPPLPYVLIVTSTQGEEITAIITVKGPVDDLKIELSSDPTYPQDEIISRLLFNRSAAQITPAQGLRVAAAVQQLQGWRRGFPWLRSRHAGGRYARCYRIER